MADRINIFISYGRADSRELALRLNEDLRAVGYSVWLDTSDIGGGANWLNEIEAAIDHCHIMLALISPASVNSVWCQNEQVYAMKLGKHILPLLAVAGTDVPFSLSSINYLDFSDSERYHAMFRDLVSDISAEDAFRRATSKAIVSKHKSPYLKSRPVAGGYGAEKRSSPAFRRYIRQLRTESWLGARSWWPYFLFYFTDLQSAVSILQDDELRSPFEQGADLNTRWDKFVQLYFRPRTPDLFGAEGFRAANQHTPPNYAPIPVYLLFELESVLCHPESRFSEGKPQKTKKTYKTPTYFKEMAFEEIYHDSWIPKDQKEEIMRLREAQVIVPERLGLESLQVIWVRSAAEYETLRSLLPEAVWKRWRDKVTARRDYHLFHHKRAYVEQAILQADQARLRFNPCQQSADCNGFRASVRVQFASGRQLDWQDEAFSAENDLLLQLPPEGDYALQLWLDDDLAYSGHYDGSLQII